MDKKNILYRISNSGYNEAVYRNYRKEIDLQNNRLVQITSFIGSIMMTILTITAFFVPSVSKVLPLYFFTAIVFIGICLVSKKKGEKNGKITLICNYAFLSAAFFFALGLDIIQKNETAATICVLLVALPLLIVDLPAREFIYFLIVSICFMLESVYIKQSPKASIDILNSLSFWLVGTFLGYKHNQMILRNIIGQELLKRQRDTDTLTDLYNKGAIEANATHYLMKDQANAGIMLVDMDNFKYVNDTYGHHAGDEILIEFAQLLQSTFGEHAMLARFGGDEFVIFVPEINDKAFLGQKAAEVLQGVKGIRITADADYRAHICMGIATYPEDGSSYEELFKNADTAMYEVKRNGKNGFGFYDPNMKKRILVVDDMEVNRVVIRETLNDQYEIFEAEDGVQALEILEQHPDICIVITDIQMPNMDGNELIRQIRSNPQLSQVAIVANTQYGDVKQENQLFQLGIDDFVYKAASPRIIQMRVKNVMKMKNI